MGDYFPVNVFHDENSRKPIIFPPLFHICAAQTATVPRAQYIISGNPDGVTDHFRL